MRTAFSLIELSIVLVILGLLTGGILAGQSLIRAAQIRAVTTEYGRYYTAIQSFRDKYFGIPGDLTNATSFWGDDNAACPDAAIANGNPGTCNGNGSGTITYVTTVGATSETLQFWKQLALAGLIEGSYPGVVPTGAVYTLGDTIPGSKLSGAGWSARTVGVAGNTAVYALDYGNAFYFGGQASSGDPDKIILKPEEAWNIDTKLDDGKPAAGKMIAVYWNNLCSVADDGSSANNDYAASYKLSDNSIQCYLLFRQTY